MTLPSPVSRTLAAAAVEEFFAAEKWQKMMSEYRWVFGMIDPLTLIVFLSARPLNSVADVFALRLACEFYPTHPPDVRFVNPETFEYNVASDLRHVPNLQAQYCYVHSNYSYQSPYKYGPQLVCSSMTLGYYFSNHTPTPDQAWDPRRHTIGTTVYTVHRALHSPHYLGRYAG
jgi:hypothetical protein